MFDSQKKKKIVYSKHKHVSMFLNNRYGLVQIRYLIRKTNTEYKLNKSNLINISHFPHSIGTHYKSKRCFIWDVMEKNYWQLI